MTHGHRHSIRNRAEFYGTSSGSGRLLLRDENGKTWDEEMSPGSLHYIAGHVTHRTINTGDVPLRFVACWPSDAGHDYDIAGENGFGAYVVEEHGKPVLKRTESEAGDGRVRSETWACIAQGTILRFSYDDDVFGPDAGVSPAG